MKKKIKCPKCGSYRVQKVGGKNVFKGGIYFCRGCCDRFMIILKEKKKK